MTWPAALSVLLVSDNARYLDLVATDLRAIGCHVLCARDLEKAAVLVRAGLATRLILIYIGDDRFSPADLGAAMAAHLPEWVVEGEDVEDRPIPDNPAPDQLVN